jgi:hypothetical protein
LGRDRGYLGLSACLLKSFPLAEAALLCFLCIGWCKWASRREMPSDGAMREIPRRWSGGGSVGWVGHWAGKGCDHWTAVDTMDGLLV